MFKIRLWLNITYRSGTTCFERYDSFPFAPYPGLDIYDGPLGEFRIRHVAWDNDRQEFTCQAREDWKDKTLTQVKKWYAGNGWTEIKEFRERE